MDTTDRPVMLIAGGSGSIGQAVAREVLAVFSSARPSFIAAFLDGLEGQHGGIENYAAALGLTAADRAAIRAGLLE